jgi:hypothetical protein
MELKNISKWIVITGALIIGSIKFGIRPFGDWGQPLKFLLGIAPNLIGSFLIPFGAYWIFSGKEFLLARLFHIHSYNDLRLVCFMGFGMLVINEYLQLIPVFGRTFDYFDLISSAIGLTASYFGFRKIFARMLYRYYPD